jgi:hypothetical protein
VLALNLQNYMTEVKTLKINDYDNRKSSCKRNS